MGTVATGKRRGKKNLKNKVLRLLKERGVSQEAIDAFEKECYAEPPRTINGTLGERDQFVNWDEYEVNEVWACITMRRSDWCA